MIFARPLTSFVAPGFTRTWRSRHSGAADHGSSCRRNCSWSIGGLLSAALQAQDRHVLPAMAPLVYSAGIIVGRPDRGALPWNGRRWICLGRAGRLRDRAFCAAALRLPQVADALAPAPVVLEPRFAALSLAFISHHDRIFNRCRRRVDRQEPGLVSGTWRAVLSAIWTDADESADRRVRHGGRCRGLSDAEPHWSRQAEWPRPMAWSAVLCG